MAARAVPFIEMDGGRLYEGNVVLNKVQCAVLDTTADPRLYLNHLLSCFFSRDVFKNSSVTGERSNRHKDAPEKTPLDPIKLNLIYNVMKEKTGMDKQYRAIAKKINNLSARKKRPLKSNFNETQSSDQEDFVPSTKQRHLNFDETQSSDREDDRSDHIDYENLDLADDL